MPAKLIYGFPVQLHIDFVILDFGAVTHQAASAESQHITYGETYKLHMYIEQRDMETRCVRPVVHLPSKYKGRVSVQGSLQRWLLNVLPSAGTWFGPGAVFELVTTRYFLP